MRTHLFVASAAACVCSIALSAQAPTTSTQKSSDTRITVTGCVERADQLAGNAATTTVDSLSFVLIKPEPTKPTGTTGSNAAAPTPSAQPDRMYRLDGKTEELNPHVGQKVEIAGTVAETPTAPAGATSSTNAPRLKVESVKVIEPTCPRS
ncbi:MAG TPA: hypothetical protein VFB07_03010 [Vicinamibacterales bacterium]|nr:hypothetical protein [Vicinamibacterales bacterium]